MLSFLLLNTLLAGEVTPRAFYVDGRAKESPGKGRLSAPFASLEEARDAIRSLKENQGLPEGGVVVNIRGGVYPLSSTFALSEEDSGMPDKPIVYRAYQDEAVVLTGGLPIPFQHFSKLTDPAILERIPPEAREHVRVVNLYEVGVKNLGSIKQQGFSTPIENAHLQVYGGGRLYELAQWPNKGGHRLKIGPVHDSGSDPFTELNGGLFQEPELILPDYQPRGGTFEIDYDRAKRWSQADSIWLRGIFARGFAHDNLKVKELNLESGTITTVQPHMFGIHQTTDENPLTKSRSYVVYNLLEEIDRPGEYYVDQNTGKLYLYPFDSTEKSEITVTVFEGPFVAVENVHDLTLSGVTLEYGRGMGVYMENTERILLDKLTVRYFGSIGIMMGQGITGGVEGPVHEFTGTPASRYVGNLKAQHYQNTTWDRKAGRNNTIQACLVHDTGAGGIILDGGSRETLEPGNNQVINCILYRNSNHRPSFTAAVTVYGVANPVRHCLIKDQPFNALALFGNDHVIEYNEISDILNNEFDDMGAIYISRDPSQMGNVIRYNYFHDIGAGEAGHQRLTGIYLDDGTGGTRLESNVFYRVGSEMLGAVLMHFGHRNVIENNLFIECPGAVRYLLATKRWERRRTSVLWQKRLFEDVDITCPPYSDRYPALDGYVDVDTRINYVRDNLFINIGWNVLTSHGEVGFDKDGDVLQEGNQTETLELPAEVFSLAMLQEPPLAEVITRAKNFKPIPFEQMGLQHGKGVSEHADS